MPSLDSAVQAGKYVGARIAKWFLKTPTRMYWAVAFGWNLAALVFLFLLGGVNSPTARAVDVAFGVLFGAPIFAAILATYVAALRGRLDDEGLLGGVLRAIDNAAARWVMTVALVYIPYYLSGWVPEKLYDAYFNRYIVGTNGESDVPVSVAVQPLELSQQTLFEDLRSSLPAILREVWELEDTEGISGLHSNLHMQSSVFADLARSLFKADLSGEVATVAREALKVLPKIQDDDWDGEDLAMKQSPLDSVLAILILAGRSDEAFSYASDPEEITGVPFDADAKEKLLRCVIQSLAEDTNEFTEAIRRVDDIRNAVGRDWSRKDICVALVNAGRVSEALNEAHQIQHDKGILLSEICDTVCETAGFNEEMLNIARSVEPEDRVRLLLPIAYALAREGRVGESKEIVKEAMDCGHGEQDWLQYWRSRVLAQAGEVEEALADASRIQHKGSWHYARSLIEIAIVLVDDDQTERGLGIIADLDTEKHDEALSAIVDASAKKGGTGFAGLLALEIDDEGRRSEALDHMLEALAKEGNVEAVMDMTGGWPVPALGILAETLARQGKADEALEIISGVGISHVSLPWLAAVYSIIRT